MLIIILSAVICLLGIPLFILSHKSWEHEESFLIIACTLFVCGGLVALPSGIIAIIQNSPHMCHVIRLEYEQQVESLNATYTSLMHAEDSYAKYTGIQQYNAEVREFKTTIAKNQAGLKNPWISWYHTSEYAKLDANVVNYIELN